MKCENFKLPVIIEVHQKNWLFTCLDKPKVSAVICTMGKMYYLKNVHPSEIEKFPITAFALVKAPLGWTWKFKGIEVVE